MTINTGCLSWDKARPIARAYFRFWKDGEDLIWCKQIWSYLEKTGLTNFHGDDDEMHARSLIGCLAIWYQEIAHRIAEETDWFLSDNLQKEILEQGFDLVEDSLIEIRSKLFDVISPEKLYFITVDSIVCGKNTALPKEIIKEEVDEIIANGHPIFNWFGWFENGSIHPQDFESYLVKID